MGKVDMRLRHGPQDGSKVRVDLMSPPPFVWVGPKWLGDGYSAFTTGGPCERFPARYRYERVGDLYQYDPPQRETD